MHTVAYRKVKERLVEPQQDVIKLACSAKDKDLITQNSKLPHSAGLRTLCVLALAKTWGSRSMHRKLLSCKTAASACAANERCLIQFLRHLLPGCAANPQTWLHKPRLKNIMLLMKMNVWPTSGFYITVIRLQCSNADSLTGFFLFQSACRQVTLALQCWVFRASWQLNS